MGNTQSLPPIDLPPTYEEFQEKYQSAQTAPTLSTSTSYSTCSRSSQRTNSNCTSSRTVQTTNTNAIEAKLSNHYHSESLGRLINCKKEDYENVKKVLELEQDITKKKYQLDKYVTKTMKKIEKMEKERDKKLNKILTQ